MTKSHYSLKKKLLVRISIPVLAAGLLISLLSFIFSWHEIAEVYDAQMAHTAHVLIELTENDIQQQNYKFNNQADGKSDIQHSYERKTGYRLWYKDQLILESLRAADFGDLRPPEGFSNQTLKGKPWRFLVHKEPEKDIVIEISQRYAIRYELIGQLMISLLIPAFLFIPIIMGLIWLATGKSLKPLIALSQAVDKRHSDDLTAIEAVDTPDEILPLVTAMNRLFKRLQDSFLREREFTDHAAHELRTPLAAMKTQTQVLLKKAGATPECRDDLENLSATIDRSSHLIDQLLSLARLQNETILMEKMDLAECLHDVIDEISSQTRTKGQTFQVNIPDHFYIRGHADSLAIMLRNFLDNAIKYAPSDSTINVTMNQKGTLEIADQGPGISGDQKARAFERFTRLDKTGQPGSGLGLSIAQWIAAAHNVKIVLKDNSPTGLIVETNWEPVR